MTDKNFEREKRLARKLRKRHAAERRFKSYGFLAIFIAFAMLVMLLGSLVLPAIDGFRRTEIALTVKLDDDIQSTKQLRKHANRIYRKSIREAFPEAVSRSDKRNLYKIFSRRGTRDLKKYWDSYEDISAVRSAIVWVAAGDKIDMLMKGKIRPDDASGVISEKQLKWFKQLRDKNMVKVVFNHEFFTTGNSREPETAGFGGAIIGSLLTMFICLAISFPLGVLSAVYLEEYAPKNRLRDIIEVNINNLAAVPSIVFGLLGLSVYLGFFGLPRSTPIVGGMVLALMILPVIIISTRVALQSVPNYIRQAALGLGASHLQVVMHHTLPLAMPGIMTGTILGLARAIGETAPLLMIGMVAFIVDLPRGIFDPATVMPVQIYMWASSPEMGFAQKTAAGILVLILILLLMNMSAIYLRKKYEKKY